MIGLAFIVAENEYRQSYVYNSFDYLLLVEDVKLVVTRINSWYSCYDSKIML
jgi:hypothetical protein